MQARRTALRGARRRARFGWGSRLTVDADVQRRGRERQRRVEQHSWNIGCLRSGRDDEDQRNPPSIHAPAIAIASTRATWTGDRTPWPPSSGGIGSRLDRLMNPPASRSRRMHRWRRRRRTRRGKPKDRTREPDPRDLDSALRIAFGRTNRGCHEPELVPVVSAGRRSRFRCPRRPRPGRSQRADRSTGARTAVVAARIPPWLAQIGCGSREYAPVSGPLQAAHAPGRARARRISPAARGAPGLPWSSLPAGRLDRSRRIVRATALGAVSFHREKAQKAPQAGGELPWVPGSEKKARAPGAPCLAGFTPVMNRARRAEISQPARVRGIDAARELRAGGEAPEEKGRPHGVRHSTLPLSFVSAASMHGGAETPWNRNPRRRTPSEMSTPPTALTFPRWNSRAGDDAAWSSSADRRSDGRPLAVSASPWNAFGGANGDIGRKRRRSALRLLRVSNSVGASNASP